MPLTNGFPLLHVSNAKTLIQINVLHLNDPHARGHRARKPSTVNLQGLLDWL